MTTTLMIWTSVGLLAVLVLLVLGRRRVAATSAAEVIEALAEAGAEFEQVLAEDAIRHALALRARPEAATPIGGRRVPAARTAADEGYAAPRPRKRQGQR